MAARPFRAASAPGGTRIACAWLALCCAARLHADERTQRLAARLSEEASAFQHIATQVLGEEVLHQRALKPPPRFRPRIGNAAKEPPKPTLQQREIVSEYSFATLSGESGEVHELRQVISVDGRKISDAAKAQENLAKVVTSSSDERKKQLLKDFERHGLIGAATDFGQLILLFAPREILKYEFTFKRQERRGAAILLVFGYKQIDGEQPLTLIEARRQDAMRKLPVEGEVWVWESSFQPVKITLTASQGEGAQSVREEAAVEYTMSSYGALLPVSTEHREIRAGEVVAENVFNYRDFKKFGASSDIKFEAEPEEPAARPAPSGSKQP
jgi:hypothetical protein